MKKKNNSNKTIRHRRGGRRACCRVLSFFFFFYTFSGFFFLCIFSVSAFEFRLSSEKSTWARRRKNTVHANKTPSGRARGRVAPSPCGFRTCIRVVLCVQGALLSAISLLSSGENMGGILRETENSTFLTPKPTNQKMYMIVVRTKSSVNFPSRVNMFLIFKFINYIHIDPD